MIQSPDERARARRRRVLIVDADPTERRRLAAALREAGYDVTETTSGAAATRAIDDGGVLDAAFVALELPDGDPLALLRPLANIEGSCAVVVVAPEDRADAAADAMRLGAIDCVPRPVTQAALAIALQRLGRHLDDRDEQRRLRRELIRHGTYEGMVGRSPAMLAVFDQIERVASTDLPIFLVGESGTGKELLARAVHAASRRRDGPFVALNCGAIPAQLAESELFGHDKGAFTGATRAQTGAFQRASGGTLFLDEVTEMPLDLQVVFLRVLEQATVRRVGGLEERPIDVRIVAASNRAPRDAVEEGAFREDLFFRLNVLAVQVPALRDRVEDLPLLAEHFLEEMAGRVASAPGAPATRRAPPQYGRDTPILSTAAREALASYPWPGNVRELRNAIARAWINHDGDVIRPADFELPAARERSRRGGAGMSEGMIGVPVDASLDEAERIIVEAQLERHGWRRARTASVLGISPKTLYNKCRKWNLEPPE